VLILSTVTGDLMALAVKTLVQRPRPSANLVEVYEQLQGYSFPSGHVVHYVVFFGVITYLACIALRSVRSTDKILRVAFIVIVVVSSMLVMLIGLSRVYLGAHWLTDVVGGYLLGGAWLLGLLAGWRRWMQPLRGRPGTRRVETALDELDDRQIRDYHRNEGGAAAISPPTVIRCASWFREDAPSVNQGARSVSTAAHRSPRWRRLAPLPSRDVYPR
jgi:hypothetical protein